LECFDDILITLTFALSGDLGYFESINKETLKNALRRYKNMGFLVTKTVYSSDLGPAEVVDAAKSRPMNSLGIQQSTNKQQTLSATTLFAVHPDLEAEVLPFINQPIPVLGTPYQSVYQLPSRETITTGKRRLTDSSGRPLSTAAITNVYGTRLWLFAEEIGKFRREGKHRRDNEVTGRRTLRLARMARHVGSAGSGAKI
jgi:hypothetical protein